MRNSMDHSGKKGIMFLVMLFILFLMPFAGRTVFAAGQEGENEEARTSEPVGWKDYNGKGTGASNEKELSPEIVPVGGVYGKLAELKGKKVGVQTGTYFDTLAAETIGEVDITYFSTLADLAVALKTGKIDAFIVEEPSIRDVMKEDNMLTYIPEYLEEMQYGVVFPKNDRGMSLKQEFDAYLLKKKEDGSLREISDIWFSDDESIKVGEDYSSLPAEKGMLSVASEVAYPPFEYMKDGRAVGFDIDIVAKFCREYGYGLSVVNMDFNGVLPAVQSGKCDLAVSAVTITEERAESVYFSEPYYDSRTIAVVLRKDPATDHSFLSNVVSSFEKTFIRENRYQLFLEGILTTVVITVASILLGTILGFLVYMLCRNGGGIPNRAADFFAWLIQGMPVVVLLMILYYVIFAKSSIDGAVVSVIAFTLVFGVAVFGMLKMGVGAVDVGQKEAAYALGFSDMRTFFRIILPQAIPHFLPSYKAEVISLIKATAVVGYIAVQDLTKMGDIVRGRTYEAFFPLIAVAIIYFILGGILTAAVSRIEISTNPKKRSEAEILKGVKTDD
ncbi:MAG: ABC transporter substrate-binding protein/permease [Bacillota bacterium]|nr:ABC transporter substrate-binding protein/permease [Bacillota bacterium]